MSQAITPRQPAGSNRPYADYVESDHGAAQSWLVSFLRHGYPDRCRESRDPYIDIYILDSVDGVLTDQAFRPHRSGEVDAAFLAALGTRPAKSKTRLVMIRGGHLGDTNSAYIDAVGWQYRLHPLFFCGPRRLPVSLPSENDYITVVQTSDSYMTTIILSSNEQATVIVLGLDHSGKRVTDLRNYLLDATKFPKDAIAAADSSPCDFLLYYIKESLRALAGLSHTLGYFEPRLDGERSPSSSFDWQYNLSICQHLMQSKNSISKHLQQNYVRKVQSCPRLTETLQDYDYLIEASRENSTQLHGSFQNYTSKQTIAEAQKSLEQADAVRRITIVGIVFIPLSFATSFFGMNFEQLGAGTLHIGYFFLVAALSGLIAFALATSIKPSERFWTRARNRYGERQYSVQDDYQWVSKSMIFWDWVRRKSPLANKLHDLWSEEKENYMDECKEFNEERIPNFKWTVSWRLLLSVSRNALRNFKLPQNPSPQP